MEQEGHVMGDEEGREEEERGGEEEEAMREMTRTRRGIGGSKL